MEEKIIKLTKLFGETGSAHHQAYIETNGADADWAIWYAEYLFDKLPDYTGVKLNKSDIVYILMHLNYEQTALAPGADWTKYYAKAFVQRYG